MTPPGETSVDVLLRPLAIVAGGVTAGVLLGAGASIPVVLVGTMVAWGVWVRSAAGRRAPQAIHPVRPPTGPDADRWATDAHEAEDAARRYTAATRGCPRGPLRDGLVALQDDVAAGATRAARLAGYGRELERAIAELDVPEVRRRLKRLPKSRGGSMARDALEAQLATAGRLDDELADVSGRLTAIVARLDDAAARATHVTVRAGTTDDATAATPATAALLAELGPLRQALAAIRDPRDEPRDAPSTG